jgi:spermidine synthase
MGWLALTGLVASISQVVLLREASVAFYGVELVYLLAIGVWMLWTGVGAACDRGRREAPGAGAIAGLTLAIGAVLPAGVAFLRASRGLAGAVAGAYLPFERQVAILACALLPAGLLTGLLFQWTARRAVAGGRSLAQAYAVESAGALVGGVLTVVWTRASGSTFGLAVAMSTTCVAACGLAWGRLPRLTRTAAALAGAGALLVATQMASIDAAMTRWTHPLLVESRDSPYGRITFSRAADQVAVFENDALAFETGGTEAELLAHAAALSHPAPSDVLLLGGAPEGLARELLQHRPRRLDIVELNVVLLEMTRRHAPDMLPAEGGAVSRIVVGDPRRYLRDAPRYDLVVVSAPDPDSGQANRFYTREFFGRCADRLGERGVLAFRLRTAENLWTPAQALRFASVHRALASRFAHVLVLPGAVNVVLASRAPLPASAEPLIERFGRRGIQARLVHPAYLAYLFSSDRRADIAETLRRVVAPANTDTTPVCYRYALVLWIGRFWPSLAGVDPSGTWASRLGWQLSLAALVVLAAVVWFSVRRPPRRRAAFVGIVALAGMLLESVVLMHFQVTQGVVFQDVGLLVAAFMAGLAVGTWWVNRVQTPGLRRRRVGCFLAGLLCCVALGLAGALAAGATPTLGTASLALVAVGALVGAGFAWASLRAGAEQRGAIAPLYAADLLGGSVGAVAGGLLLIPLLGLTATALVGGALAVVAAVLA